MSNIVNGFSVSHAAILNGTTGAEETNGDIYGVRSASLAADLGTFDNTGDDAVLDSWYWLNFATLTVEGGYIPFDLLALLTGDSITTSGSATKAVVEFTPAATGSDAFDYASAAAISFTINDGTGATTVTLDADYTNLAGVVAAVDADLGSGYVVTADSTKVKIEAATAGEKTFAIGGTNASAITGSTGYINTSGTAGSVASIPLWSETSVNVSPKPVLIRVPARDHLGTTKYLDIVLYKVSFSPISFQGPQYKSGLTINYSGRALMSTVDETGTTLATRAVGRLLNKPTS